MLRAFFKNYILPMISRPARYQVAALCYRAAPAGIEVLMVTSLDTGRWILPKGWPQSGRAAGATALEEAWEEAGIRPEAGAIPHKIGQYRYQKRLKRNVPVTTDVDVFAIAVVDPVDSYPESARRKRVWMRPAEAAKLVQEPSLKTLLEHAEALVAALPAPKPDPNP